MAHVEGYRLIQAAPEVEQYIELRKRTGLTPRTREQAVAALAGSWFTCHIVYESTGRAVAMGRVIGDGGWYFHVVDMAVLPEHQRRGLGDAVLTALLHHVRDHAPAGAHVSLLADPPGRRLYARHGFSETAPDSIGMALLLP
jgi:ribosomal protein S18 acetylase RimI-like enzyme